MWIFGSARRDVAWLIAPGLLTMALAWTVPATSPGFLVFAFITLYAIDSGHGYATGLRTYFFQSDCTRGWLTFYIAAPVIIFLGAMFLLHSGFPYFWTCVVYGTMFHHVRQFYGVQRWYEKLNRNYVKLDHFFLYALTAFPMLIFHGRETEVHGHFTGTEFLHIDTLYFLPIALPLYYALLVLWGMHEVRKAYRGQWRINQFSALALPAGISGISFLFGNSAQEILFPMLVVHGVSYIGLTGLSMNKLQPKPAYKTMFVSSAAAFTVAAAFGIGEHFFEEAFVIIDVTALAQSWWLAAGAALVATPPLTHYLLDAIIWRGDHPDSKVIYAS